MVVNDFDVSGFEVRVRSLQSRNVHDAWAHEIARRRDGRRILAEDRIIGRTCKESLAGLTVLCGAGVAEALGSGPAEGEFWNRRPLESSAVCELITEARSKVVQTPIRCVFATKIRQLGIVKPPFIL
jgi:hypothetical protein